MFSDSREVHLSSGNFIVYYYLMLFLDILLKHDVNHRPYPLQPRGLVNRGNWCYVNAVSFVVLCDMVPTSTWKTGEHSPVAGFLSDKKACEFYPKITGKIRKFWYWKKSGKFARSGKVKTMAMWCRTLKRNKLFKTLEKSREFASTHSRWKSDQ